MSGVYSRVSSLISVVLPEPFSPTSARLSPGRSVKLTSRTAGSVAPGYVKLTCSKRRPVPGEVPVVTVPDAAVTGVSRYSYSVDRYRLSSYMPPIAERIADTRGLALPEQQHVHRHLAERDLAAHRARRPPRRRRA